MTKTLAALATIAALHFGIVGRADAKAPAEEAEAKRLFQEGNKAYNLAEYDEAIKGFRAAYRVLPRPSLLYNLAQAYRLSSDFKNALVFYKNFLNAMPDTPNRAEVEARIQEMQDAIDAESRSQLSDRPMAPQETTTIASPDKAAEASSAGEEAATAPAPRVPADDAPSKPIYKKWWFWTGIGVVAVGATVATVALSSGGGTASAPGTSLGNHLVFGAR